MLIKYETPNPSHGHYEILLDDRDYVNMLYIGFVSRFNSYNYYYNFSCNHVAWEGVDKTDGWHRSVQWRERRCELTWTYKDGFFLACITAFLLAIGSVWINWGKSNIICSYHYVVVKLMYVCLICWILKVIFGATGLTGCTLAYLKKEKLCYFLNLHCYTVGPKPCSSDWGNKQQNCKDSFRWSMFQYNW